MFSSLFFILLNLLLLGVTSEIQTFPLLPNHPEIALSLFIGTYFLFATFLYIQTCWVKEKLKWNQARLLFFTNIEILIFFSFSYFLLGPQRAIVSFLSPFGITSFTLISLISYFTLLFIFYYQSHTASKERLLLKTWQSTLFLIPFSLPFLFLTLIAEIFEFFSTSPFLISITTHLNSLTNPLLFFLFSMVILIALLIFFPPLTIWIWQCPALNQYCPGQFLPCRENEIQNRIELKKELDELCKRAHFKHAGFKVWTVLGNSMTAAIIGIFYKLRYILFTQSLLKKAPNRVILAILAHEIGHSAYFHLLFYPLILLGMTLFPAAFASSLYFIVPSEYLQEASSSLILIFSFFLFSILMALYFRFVFGYFSRLFERQADLHIFKLNIPAADMVEALNLLGKEAGNTHLEPNWHHYSIQQRIDFIKKATEDKKVIFHHFLLVNISLIIYFALLFLSVIQLTHIG